ncbi:hypothetical protein [Mesorhizobium sp.]|uniref:hypothetical protein n=3 Tax=unclassified Mesorhizobium TaxID=325217 RepID=UPI000FD4B2CB|nr:hypothetical protein [Mesorhizobium sp.]RUV97273.1 hypothetical protein EOA88_01655 [Mesorhizobium sp. M5C.F.Ca.IN.020.14.1.1]RWG50721.1 MAG: hypothetical protein EOQ62_03410 [Mesorhizobium sp.]RWH55692.1 MAG: hypothetical protein EOQ82_15025 [Mesorhizobium sp.]RWI70718.1 MAG: hypothetical protein EOR18_18375 [Mesorhizobium sp.]RWI77684.1 MAG: hypothetical protein EOR19_13515 [Mesorhizobium sp.]
MNSHLRRSRIVKVITDAAGSERDFDQAAAALDAVHIAVVIKGVAIATAAVQAAVVTALNTAVKCFGKATLVCPHNPPLEAKLALGRDLWAVAEACGAQVSALLPSSVTHIVAIGETPVAGAFVRCWWNGWSAGVLPGWDDELCGDAGNPLSGVFAGALAVREVFANAIGRRHSVNRRAAISLWQPWLQEGEPEPVPTVLTLPRSLWLVGLGHLGQGFLWSLAFLPADGTHAILQDDQTVGEENVGTGLVTQVLDFEKEIKKARVAARWLEGAGWTTSLIERRNYGDLRLTDSDPPVILTSLDEPTARVAIAKAGHSFMIDAGVGHGAFDFEIGQIRVVPKGADTDGLWAHAAKPKNIDAMLETPAYREHARKFDGCGTFILAEASAAVPFVGAAIGALTIAQLLRVASMCSTPRIMQVELNAPDTVSAGTLNPPTAQGLGGIELRWA